MNKLHFRRALYFFYECRSCELWNCVLSIDLASGGSALLQYWDCSRFRFHNTWHLPLKPSENIGGVLPADERTTGEAMNNDVDWTGTHLLRMPRGNNNFALRAFENNPCVRDRVPLHIPLLPVRVQR